MTNILVSRFFFNRAYYRLRNSDRVDNPDQRIQEDIRSFTTGVLGYLLTLINSGVTLCAFTGVLFTISWKLPLVLLIYAGAGTGLSILIGKRLVGLHFRQYQKEANFRYALVRVRDNAESIAFFRGEKREQRDLVARFGEVVNNTLRIIGWNRTLGFLHQWLQLPRVDCAVAGRGADVHPGADRVRRRDAGPGRVRAGAHGA